MRLFAKLLVVMLAVGATALGLLALRQQRYEVSNEISRAHDRIVRQERDRWRMSAEIARRSDPSDIRGYAERLRLDLAPIQESTKESTAADRPEEPLAGRSASSVRPASPSPAKPAAPKPASPKAGKSTRGKAVRDGR